MKTIHLLLALVLAAGGSAMAQEGAPAADGCPAVAEWGAPARLQLAAVPSGLRISWMLPPTTATDITGFQIFRALDLNGPYLPAGVAERTATEFIDTTAVPGTIYYYRVRAFQGGVCTPFSDPVFGQR